MIKQKPLRTVPAGGPAEPLLRRTALALLIAACFNAAHANPVLPQVVHGQATFNQQGNLFTITNTPNTIINWQSFSVNPGEITRFLQQNAGSSVLNRITGQDPSKILGSLQSNGKVFLINPNGVLFGRDARVDVAGLVASSLALSNQDFLAGKMNFKAGDQAGAVLNQGTINAGSGGQILLIAPNVENSGIITAPNGDVLLAAGHSVQLADAANPDLRVVLSAPADQAINVGQIVAQGGRIGMVGALLNQRGVLNANSAMVGENGKIVLKATGKALLENGSVTSATSAVGKGGEITVLGDQVGMQGNARADASGATGGGTVLLGGDYQGKNPAIVNARQVAVGKDATIAADAIQSGDGGKVIVWGNETARVFGSISARGGAASGNGGLVETSGHYLAVDGARVDTRARAARGKTGDWLLDPYDIDVVAGNGGVLSGVNDFAEAPTGKTSIGAGLIPQAASNVVLQAQHDINFNEVVAITQAGVGLTAQAGNSINVKKAISINGGALILSANDNGGATAQGSSAVLHIDAALSSQGGGVALTGADIVFGVAGSLNVGGGNAELRANKFDGRIDLNGSGGQIVGTAVGQTLLLQADNMNLQGGVAYGGAAGGAAVALHAQSANREINLGSKAVGKLSLSSTDLNAISAANLTLGHAAMTGAIGVDQAVTVASGATGPATLQLVTGGAMAIDHALAVAGNLSLTAGSTVSAAGAVSVGATFRLASGTWTQNTTGLPAFSASNFIIAPGASFLRTTNGDGSAGAPYVIADVYGLQGIASLDLSNSYRLAGNIDASGTGAWNDGAGFRPIAHSDSGGFSGVLDGAGYAVSGLQIHGESAPNGNLNTGLFGKLGNGTTGKVRQLNLLGGNASGNNNVGAVAGVVAAGGTIEQVQSSMSVAGQDGVGGLVGINQGRIAVSYASGSVSGARNLGGLVGSNQGTLADVYATGAVGAAGNADAGITREHIGGLAGENTGSISNAYASGAIAGGGFSAVGGLVGSNSGALASTYWNIDSSGQADDGGTSIGRTAAQMSRLSSFDGFAFGASPIWRIYDGYTTPMLKAFLTPLTVTASGAASRVYDGQVAGVGTLSYVGLLNGDLAASGTASYGDARNVGNYALGGLWSTKYDISLGGTTTLAITPRALTVSVGGSKVYDGQLGFANATLRLGNMASGDTVGVTGSAQFVDKNAGTAKAVNLSELTLSGSAMGNYSLAATAIGTAEITQRTLNLAFAGANKVYDGGTAAVVTVTDNRVTGDALTASAAGAFADKNAGTGKTITVKDASLSGLDASNYTLGTTGGTATASIAQRTLNLGYTGVDKVYDGVTGAQVAISDDRIAGDVLSASASAAFADKNAGGGKTITVQNASLSGNDAGNYRLANTTGATTATIARAALTLASVSARDKVYDGTQVAKVSGTVAGVIGQDAVSLAGGGGTFADRNYGSGKTVNVSGFGLSGADAGNYALTSTGGLAQASIAQRALSTWIGATGGLWSDAANWEGGVAPSGANVLAADFAASTGNVVYTAAAGDTVLDSLSSRGGLNLTGGSLLVNNALTVANYAQTGGLLGGLGNVTVSNSFSQSAGAIHIGGKLAVTQAAGDLRFAALTANAISLNSGAGAISQSGAVVAGSLVTQSQTGTVLSDAGNRVKRFSAGNSGAGGIALTNTSVPDVLVLGGLSTGSGDVRIESTGGIESHAINANSGNVSLIAHSSVNVQGVVKGNDVTVDASTDVAFGDGAHVNAARAIAVTAGTGVTFAGAARLDVQATGGIAVLAKNGDLTAAETVRINSRGAPVSLLAPNGRVNVPASVLVAQPVTTPVVPPSTIISASNTLPALSEQYNPLNQLTTPNNVTTPLLADTTSKESTKEAPDELQKSIKKTYCN